MPRAFSNKRSEEIREQILTKAKKLFAEYGYKSFGIRELTKQVGIASGMFYKFFKSKNELFYIIIEEEQYKVRTKIFREMMKLKEDPVTALKQFYYIIIEEMNHNPLVRIALTDEYKDIILNLPKEKLIEERNDSMKQYVELVQFWSDQNMIRDRVDLNLILESLRSLVYLWFHQDEIGRDRYPVVIDFLINQICESVQ